MAQHIIPANAGPYRIVKSTAGTPLVINDKTGKRKVQIPCKNKAQADEVLRKLQEDDHNGVIHA